MKPGKRPTVNDVAAEAGVGASTVSRYVRGAKSVSADVAQRIELAVAKLRYEPNALARSLRVGRTRTLGVLFPHVSNIFYADALRAIEEEAQRHGFTVLLLTHEEDKRLQATQLIALKQHQTDGLLLIAAAGTEPDEVRQLVGSTPLVALDRALGEEWDSVTLNNEKAGWQATEYLLKQGHRNIIAITTHRDLSTLKQRFAGYVGALDNVAAQPCLIVFTSAKQLEEDLVACFERQNLPATAILALSYSIGVGALHAMKRAGISLRETGFIVIDEMEFATLMDPAITTISQPADQLARLAFQRLHHRMLGARDQTSHVTLDGEMMVRESCGLLEKALPKRPCF
jgi:DNA-binding LacI/PurR family transcriptional regulator